MEIKRGMNTIMVKMEQIGEIPVAKPFPVALLWAGAGTIVLLMLARGLTNK